MKVKEKYSTAKRKYQIHKSNSCTGIILEIYEHETELTKEQDFLIKELEQSTLKLYVSLQELNIPWI